MPITRRSRQFRQVAEATEELLRKANLSDVSAADVDAALNVRIEFTATLMGIEARTAMNYMPDHMPEILVDNLRRTVLREANPDVAILDEHRPWGDAVDIEKPAGAPADVIDLRSRRAE